MSQDFETCGGDGRTSFLMGQTGRESGFDRKNFMRKLVRGGAVKRNSYNEFVHWLQDYKA